MEVVYSTPKQSFLGRGSFSHKVPEFILHKAAGSKNRMKLLLLLKTDAKTETDDRSNIGHAF